MLVEDLIKTHGARLWRLCLHLAGQAQDAEELYQKTFLRALECQDRLNPDENPGAWLCATAAGLWKSSLRLTARRRQIAPEADVQALELLTDAQPLEEALIRRERAAQLAALVAQLEEKYRLPLVLYYSGGLTEPEIAAALHLPQGTVKSRLSRARTRLKKQWEESHYDT